MSWTCSPPSICVVPISARITYVLKKIVLSKQNPKNYNFRLIACRMGRNCPIINLFQEKKA